MPTAARYLTGLLAFFSTAMDSYPESLSKEDFESSQLHLLELAKQHQRFDSFAHWTTRDPAISWFLRAYPPYQTSIELFNLLASLNDEGATDSTVKNYRSDITQYLQFHGQTQASGATSPARLDQFVEWQLAKGLALSSIQRKLSSLQRYSEWLTLAGLEADRSAAFDRLSEALPERHTTAQKTKQDPKLLERKGTGVRIHIPTGTPSESVASEVVRHEQRRASSLLTRTTSATTAARQRLSAGLAARILPYVNLAMIALFVVGGGWFGYQQFVARTEQPLAAAGELTRPNRSLSFQGRLTDIGLNPITTATDMQFKLYDNITGGTLLWDSGTCSITGDQDGIFSVGLGDECGAEIAQTVFAENANVYLEVKVGTETLDPRQPIKSVAYALNAETLQGFPPSETATPDTILAMNGDGDVVLASTNPVLKSTGTSFSIEAQTLTLQTTAGTNGNIAFSPDGTGEVTSNADFNVVGDIDLTGALRDNGNAGTSGQILASNGTGIDWVDPDTVTDDQTLAEVLVQGNTTSGNNIVLSTTDELRFWDDDADSRLYSSADGTIVLNTNTFNLDTGTIDASTQAVAVSLINSNNALNFDSNTLSIDALNNRVGIGTSSPTVKLDINDGSVRPLLTRLDETATPPSGISYQSGGGATNPEGWTYPYGVKLSVWEGATRNFEIATKTYPNSQLALRQYNPSGSAWDTWRTILDSAHDISSSGNLQITGSGDHYISAGNVGIGDTTPTYKLDVAGTGRFTGAADFDGDIELNSTLTDVNNSAGVSGQVLSSTGAGVDWVDVSALGVTSIWDTDADTGVQTEESADEDKIRFDTAGTERMIIDNAGNVGIGTTTPDFALQVNGIIAPETSAQDLGTSSLRWDLYANTIDAASTVTLGGLTASRAVFTNASKQLVSSAASSSLSGALTDETGTGVAVFGTSPSITTALNTGSTSFNLLNSTATTINFAGAATTLEVGAATGTTSVNNNLTIDGNTTIGNASGDTLTANAANWTFANDTNFALSGGVNGLSFDTDTLSIDATNDRVGVGTTSPSSKLNVVFNIDETQSVQTGLHTQISANASQGTAVGYIKGNRSLLTINADSLLSFTTLDHGFASTEAVVAINGNGTINNISTINSSPLAYGTVSLTNLYGARIRAIRDYSSGGASVSNYYGVFIEDFQNGGATLAPTNSWGIYQSGANDPNYFAGNVGIGDTTPTYNLDVNGTGRFTGAVDLDGDLELNSTLTDINNSAGTSGQVLSSTGTGVDWVDVSALGVSSIWDSDTDTGIQTEESADEDKIRFDTAGAERMIIDNAGLVGIGTTSPGQLLTLYGTGPSSVGTLGIIQNSAPTGSSGKGAHIMFGDTADSTRGWVGYFDSSDHGVGTQLNLKSDGAIGLAAGGLGGVNDVTIATSGNVGIGTTAPDSTLSVNGDIELTTSGQFEKVMNANMTVIEYPEGGYYQTTTYAVTGAIEITLPVDSTSDMMKIWVDVYDYSANESFTVILSGYNYSGASNPWVNTSVQVLGSDYDRDLTVRFGDDGTNDKIWIGELTSTWNYPQVVIREVMLGFTSQLANWQGAWSVGFESTAFDTVDETVSQNFPLAGGLSAPSGGTLTALINGSSLMSITSAGVDINGDLELNSTLTDINGSAGTTGQILSSTGTGTDWVDVSTLGVTSVTGTTYQITASPTTGDVVLSIPSDFRAPGTVNAVSGLYTGSGAGTKRVDETGDLVNITNITAAGDTNSTNFSFTGYGSTTGEQDIFVITDTDAGGGGQDESSTLKVIRTGAFNAADDGSSLLELTYTGVTADTTEQFYTLGRLADEGAVEWGIDIANADFWTTGSLYGGATGTDCGGTNAPCFNSPSFKLAATGDSYLQNDLALGKTTAAARLEIEGDGSNPELLLSYGGSNLYATIQGPLNRDLRFDLDGNGATDKFHFRNTGSYGAADLLVIEAEGHVGIGTTSPAATLDVNGDLLLASGTNVNNIKTTVGTPGDDTSLVTEQGIREAITAAGGTIDLQQAYENGGTVQLTAGEGDIRFYNDAAQEMLYLDESTGNVGIGTTAPGSYKLNVIGSANVFGALRLQGAQQIEFEGGGANEFVINHVFNDKLSINTSAVTDALVIKETSGNVGIGTTNPTERLDIGFDSTGFAGRKYNEGQASTTGAGIGNGGTITLNAQHGTTLTPEWHYKIRLHTNGTGTDSGAYYIVWYDESAGIWQTRMVSRSGSTSNHPLLGISGTNAIAYHNHTSSYSIHYTTEAIYKALDDGSEHSLGADFQWQRDVDTLFYTDGNVGVGTNAPINKLDVRGNTNFGDAGTNSRVSIYNDEDITANAATKGLRLQESTGDWTLSLGVAGTTNVGFGIRDNVAGSYPLVLRETTGNIGIGTVNPSQKLHVASSGSGGIQITNTGGNDPFLKLTGGSQNWLIGVDGNGTLNQDALMISYNNGSNNLLTLDDTGNVGIGTTSPSFTLDVSGTGRFTGALRLDSTLLDGNAQAGTTGQVLSSTGAGVDWVDVSALGVSSIWDTDTDTGIQTEESADEDKIRFDTAGSERMIIDNAGRVGIGTSSPEGALHIDGNGTTALVLKGGSATDQQIIFNYARQYSQGIYNASGNYRLRDDSGGKDIFSWDNTNLSLTPTSGNVGIGTTNPLHKFQVQTGSTANDMSIAFSEDGSNQQSILFSEMGTGFNPYFAIQHDGSATNPSNLLKFQSDGGSADGIMDVDIMTFTQQGNVGIGTSSPDFKLHVHETGAGNVNAFFGDNTPGQADSIYIAGQEINMGYQKASDTGTMYLNYSGYLNSTSYFRDTVIGDGKNAAVLMVDGSAGNVGIGTTSPTQSLEIDDGNILVQGVGSFDFAGETASLFLGDTNHGVNIVYGQGMELRTYDNANYSFRFQNHNDDELVLIKADTGDVGIGTTTPSYKLDVAGTGRFTGAVDFDGDIELNSTLTDVNGSTGTSGQVLSSTVSGVDWVDVSALGVSSIWDSDTDTGIQTEESADEDKIRFDTAGSERMIIDDAGLVGIGTSSPGETLEVAGSLLVQSGGTSNLSVATDGTVVLGRLNSTSDITAFTDQFKIQNRPTASSDAILQIESGNGPTAYSTIEFKGTAAALGKIEYDIANNQFGFTTNGTQSVVIDSSGEVGIGDTTPDYDLDVAGDIRATGTFFANGGTTGVPTYSFFGDTDTGFNNRIGNHIYIINGGVDSGMFDSANRFRWGGSASFGSTSVPSFTLDVTGTGRFTGALRLDSTLLDKDAQAGTSGQILSSTGTGTDWVDISSLGYNYWRIQGDTGGPTNVTDTYLVDFEGGEGIDTAFTANKLTISGEDATTTNKGIASFNDSYFGVSAGAVTIDDIYLRNTGDTGTGNYTFSSGYVQADNLRLDGNTLSSTTGAITLQPVAGQNVNVTTSGTGDFVVNTNQLYVDASTGYVGVGTSSPGALLSLNGGFIQQDTSYIRTREWSVVSGSGTQAFYLGKIRSSSSVDGAISGVVDFSYDYGTTSISNKLHFDFAQRNGTARGRWWYEHSNQDGAADRIKVQVIDVSGSGTDYEVWAIATDFAASFIRASIRQGGSWTSSGILSATTISTGTVLYDTSNDPTSDFYLNDLYALGSIGINTTSPGATLDVNGDLLLASGTNVNNIKTTVGTPGDDNSLVTEQGIREALDALGAGVGLQEAYENGNTVQLTATEGDIRFYNDASAEMLFLDESTGNVGIGTTSPSTSSKLTVNGGVQSTDMRFAGEGYLTYDVSNTGTVGLTVRRYGTTTLKIDNQDRVGIGTASPTDKLDVDGGLRIRGTAQADTDASFAASGLDAYKLLGIRQTDTSTNLGGIGMVYQAGYEDLVLYSPNNNTNNRIYFGGLQAGDRNLGTGFTADMVVDTYNHRVGIGTTSPSEELEVVGSIYTNSENNGVIVDAGGNKRVGLMKFGGKEGGIWRTATQDFEIGRVTAGSGTTNISDASNGASTFTTDFYIDGTGNVGIGTTTPGQELEVTGDAFITSTLYVGNESNSPWAFNTGNGAIRGKYGADTSVTIANNYSGGFANLYLNKIDAGASILASQNRVLGIYTDGTQTSTLSTNAEGDLGIVMTGGDDFIVSGGNVGIGTTDPNTVNTTPAHQHFTTSDRILQIQSPDANTQAVLNLSSSTVTQDGILGTIAFTASAGQSDAWRNKFAIQAVRTDTDILPDVDLVFVSNPGNTERMRIDGPTGHIGIGDDTPDAPLDVVGDVYISDGLSLFETAVSNGTVEATKFCTGDGETNCVTDFSSAGTDDQTLAEVLLEGNTTGGTDILVGTGDNLSLASSSGGYSFLQGNLTGNGTKAGGSNMLQLESRFDDIVIQAGINDSNRRNITLRSGDTHVGLVVDTGGEVGIGLTNPSQALHVSGNSLVTGNTYIGSSDSYFYSDAANRIATPDSFYVQSGSAATYLYSDNTYLGASNGDNIRFRSNEVFGDSWRISSSTGALHTGSNTEYDYNRFGSGGTVNFAGDGNDDVYIKDELEVDTAIYTPILASGDSLTIDPVTYLQLNEGSTDIFETRFKNHREDRVIITNTSAGTSNNDQWQKIATWEHTSGTSYGRMHLDFVMRNYNDDNFSGSIEVQVETHNSPGSDSVQVYKYEDQVSTSYSPNFKVLRTAGAGGTAGVISHELWVQWDTHWQNYAYLDVQRNTYNTQNFTWLRNEAYQTAAPTGLEEATATTPVTSKLGATFGINTESPQAQFQIGSGTFTTNSTDEMVIVDDSPTIRLEDTSGTDDFWMHVNANNFYILADRDDNGSWEGPYPLQLEADTDTAYVFGNEICDISGNCGTAGMPSGTSGQTLRHNGSDWVANSVLYNDGTNIGIGTTSLTAQLNVAGSATSGNSLSLRSGDVGTGTDSTQIAFGYNNAANYQHAIQTRHNGGGDTYNAIDFYLWDQGTDAVGTIGTKRVLTLDGTGATGRVGIGEWQPEAQLHIHDNAITNSGNTTILKIEGYNGDVGPNPQSVSIDFHTSDTNSNAYSSIRHAVVNDTDYGDNDEGAGNLIFSTSDAGVSSDKMIITGRGNIGIGTLNPSYKLEVSGDTYTSGDFLVTSDDGIGDVTGTYGSVQTVGSGAGNWEGYSINGRYVFMSSDNETVGIYNDVDNRWALLYDRNTYFRIYEPDSGNVAFEMQNSGDIDYQNRNQYNIADSRASRFEDDENNAYYLDPASTGTALNVAGDIDLNGKALTFGFITTKDYYGNRNIIADLGNTLYKSDQRFTCTGSCLSNYFDGRDDTYTDQNASASPIISTINFNGPRHYWDAIRIYFAWNSYTKHFKIERLRDTDTGTNGSCDGDVGTGLEEVWELYDEPTTHNSAIYENHADMGSWVCGMRFTFYREAADLNDGVRVRIGEIQGWQFYYGAETGQYASRNGFDMYGTINMNTNALTNTAAVYPATNDTYDLGTSSLRWNDVFVDRICFDGASDCMTSSSAGGLWSDGGTTTYLTAQTDDVAIGGTSSTAPFFFDESAGRLTLNTNGSGGGLVLGSDTLLYRSAADELTTPDSMVIGGAVTAGYVLDQPLLALSKGDGGYAGLSIDMDDDASNNPYALRIRSNDGGTWVDADDTNLIVKANENATFVGIDTDSPETSLHVRQGTTLGSTAGNAQLAQTLEMETGNNVFERTWLYRDAAGSNFTTARVHNGISVDVSYGTPGTDTRTWWERDPYNNIQQWGTGSSVHMTLDSAGDLGIGGVTNPAATLSIGNGGTHGVQIVNEDSSSTWFNYNNSSTNYIRGTTTYVDTTLDLNDHNVIDVQEIRFNDGSNHSITSNSSGLVFDGGDGSADFLIYDNRAYSDRFTLGYSGSALIDTYDTNESLTINANGTGRVDVLTSGSGDFSVATNILYVDTSASSVGIGTTSPAGFVNTSGTYFRPDPASTFSSIYSTTQATLNLMTNQNADDAVLGGLYFTRTAGQADAHRQVAGVEARQESTGTLSGGELWFFTKPVGGGATSSNARLIIDDDGSVQVGDGGTINFATSDGELYVENDLEVDGNICLGGVCKGDWYSAAGWEDLGTIVSLETNTDNVSIGTNSNFGKLTIDGDTDEVQLWVQGHSSQSNYLALFENSGGTDLARLNNSGYFDAQRFADIANTNYYLDPASTSTSLLTAGKVGIQTTSPQGILDIAAGTDGTAAITISGAGSGGSTDQNYTYLNVLNWHHDAANQTGALVINVPDNGSTMMTIRITGYEYETNYGAWELVLGAYRYNTDTNAWINEGAYLTGTPKFTQVRLMREGAGGAPRIVLGDTSTDWDYPQIKVDVEIAGYSCQDCFEDGWTADILTDISALTAEHDVTIKTYTDSSGNFKIGSNGYLDDDFTFGENADDWLRFNGYIEMKSNTDSYGIVLRDKDTTSYFGLTQVGGMSYLADNTTYSNYFIRGDGADAQVRGNLTVNGGYLYGSSSQEALRMTDEWLRLNQNGDFANGVHTPGDLNIYGSIYDGTGSLVLNDDVSVTNTLTVGGATPFSGAEITVEGTATPNIVFANSGVEYLRLASDSQYNVFLGKSAGDSISLPTGTNNIGIGAYALEQTTTGNGNVAIGTSALTNNNGAANIAIGYLAAENNSTGYMNIAIGNESLIDNTSGNQNLAVGFKSLNANLTGSNNIAIGVEALQNSTAQSSSLAIGKRALQNNSSTGLNLAIGLSSMINSGSATNSIGIGASSLAFATGDRNIGIGLLANYAATGGDNIGLGNSALQSVTSGARNIGIGNDAGLGSLTTGSDNILIGYNVDSLAAGSSNTLNIGDAIYGSGIYNTDPSIGINQTSPTAKLHLTDATRGSIKILADSGVGRDFGYDGGTGGVFEFANTSTSGSGYTSFYWDNGTNVAEILRLENDGDIFLTPVDAGTVNIQRQNNANEGGEINWHSGGSYTATDWRQDVYLHNMRMYFYHSSNSQTNVMDCGGVGNNTCNITTDGTASDFAETVITDQSLEGGDIIYTVPANNEDGIIGRKTTTAYQKNAVGIVSTTPGTTLKAPMDGGEEMGGFYRGTLVGRYTEEMRIKYPWLAPLALSGRVPVKVVVNQGETIDIGAYITSSNLPGVGQEAKYSATSVGKATTPFIPTNLSCKPVKSLQAITWPKDPEGINEGSPCFRLPDGRLVGKVMVFVTTAHYNPDISFDENGQIAINGDTGEYNVIPSGKDVLTTTIAAARSFTAQATAGLTTTRELVVENTAEISQLAVDQLSVGGQAIQDLIASLVEREVDEAVSQQVTELEATLATQSAQPTAIATDSATIAAVTAEEIDAFEIDTERLTARSTELGELLAETATVSGTLEAATISADTLLTDLIDTATISAGLVEAERVETDSLLAQLIDADSLETDILGAATISATTTDTIQLTAEDLDAQIITTDELDATSSRIDTLEGRLAELEEIRAQTAEIVTATISGTLYADHINEFEKKVADSLQTPGLMDVLRAELAALTGSSTATDSATTGPNLAELYQSVESSGFTATSAAELNKNLSELDMDEDDVALGANAAFIGQYFKVNGSGYVAQNFGIGQELLIGEQTAIGSGYVAFGVSESDSLFEIQPSGAGTLSLMAGLLVLEGDTVAINGDVSITGNVAVGGTLLTDIIRPTEFTNPLQVQVAGRSTTSDEVQKSRFEIIDELGTPVATISAEGRASFSGGIGVGADGTDELEGPLTTDLTTGELPTTDKTSGKAIMRAGTSQLTIAASAVTAESLIYVTPVGSTNNQVVYVASQTADDPATLETNEASFTVAIDSVSFDDIQFNWWIVN